MDPTILRYSPQAYNRIWTNCAKFPLVCRATNKGVGKERLSISGTPVGLRAKVHKFDSITGLDRDKSHFLKWDIYTPPHIRNLIVRLHVFIDRKSQINSTVARSL